MRATVSIYEGNRGNRRSPDHASCFGLEVIGEARMHVQWKRLGVLALVCHAAVGPGVDVYKVQGMSAGTDT
jgi:hypothetical protein